MEKIKRIVKLYQNRVQNGDDIIRQTRIYGKNFSKLEITSDESIELFNKLSILKDSKDLILGFFKKILKLDDFTGEEFTRIIKELQKEYEVKGPALWYPIRLAFTGEVAGPNLAEMFEIMGKEKVIILTIDILELIYKLNGIVYDEN